MFLSFLKAVTKAEPFLPTLSLQGGVFVDFLAAFRLKKANQKQKLKLSKNLQLYPKTCENVNKSMQIWQKSAKNFKHRRRFGGLS